MPQPLSSRLLPPARHLLPTNITQGFPCPRQAGVCAQTCAGKRSGCCKGNSKATYRGSALTPWAGFHPQPHTALAGGRDALPKRNFVMP